MEAIEECQLCTRKIQSGDKLLTGEVIEAKGKDGNLFPWHTGEFYYYHIDCWKHWREALVYEASP